MREVKIEFGHGTIHPKIKAYPGHAKATKSKKSEPMIEFGGNGTAPPAIKSHLKRAIAAKSKKQASKIEFGHGARHPLIVRHLRLASS